MRTVIVGRDLSTLAISSSSPKLRAWMVALLVSKKIFCLSSIFSWVTTMCSYFFGQPSLSGGPGSFGHLSAASSTPSLSLSGSGQPSASSNPSLSSGSLGHLSVLSGMPSLSLSGSGQPSASSKPSLSSGSVGHLSSLSMMPSPSVSGGLGGGLQRALGDSSMALRALSSAMATSRLAGKYL